MASTAAAGKAASSITFCVSAFQGFDGTENHDSLDDFVCGSAGVASGALATTVSGEDCSRSFTRATSSTAVTVSLALFSCEAAELAAPHASAANGVVEIA